jgi:hypothetical protein
MTEQGADAIPLLGRIYVVERLGKASYVYMQLASGDEVTVRTSDDVEVSPSEQFNAYPSLRMLHVFDNAGRSPVQRKR